MSKNSKFTFDVDAFIGGTMAMNEETLGCYLRLWMLQCKKNEFTLEEAKEILPNTFEKNWAKLQKKFHEQNGHYYNHRLRKELEKSKKKKYIDIELKLPFTTEGFKLTWAEWIEYKEARGEKYKTNRGQQKQLEKLSTYKEEIAIQMIHKSMRSNWADIYPIKNIKQQESLFDQKRVYTTDHD